MFSRIIRIKGCAQKKNKCIKINNLYLKNIKNEKIKLLTKNYRNGEFPIYVQALVDNRLKFKKYLSKKKIEIRYLPPSLSEANYLNKNSKKLSKIHIYYHRKVCTYHVVPLKILKI